MGFLYQVSTVLCFVCSSTLEGKIDYWAGLENVDGITLWTDATDVTDYSNKYVNLLMKRSKCLRFNWDNHGFVAIAGMCKNTKMFICEREGNCSQIETYRSAFCAYCISDLYTVSRSVGRSVGR